MLRSIFKLIMEDLVLGFLACVVKEYLLLHGISSSKATPNHLQTNTQVEHNNIIIWKTMSHLEISEFTINLLGVGAALCSTQHQVYPDYNYKHNTLQDSSHFNGHQLVCFSLPSF